MSALLAVLALWRNRHTEEGASNWRKFVRKWFGYILIALLLAVSSLAITNHIKTLKQDVAIAGYQKAQQQAQNAITQLQAVNQQQDETIQRIGAIREIDGTVLTGLQTDLARLRARDSALDANLKRLEKSNAQVRALMSTRTDVVPGGGCMLDNSCGADEDRGDHPAPKPSRPLPAPETGPGAGSAGLRYKFQRSPVCFR